MICQHRGVRIENRNNKTQLGKIEDDLICRSFSQSGGSAFDTPCVKDNLFDPLCVL